MARKKNTTGDEALDNTIEIATKQPQKVSVRLFRVLRERVQGLRSHYHYATPTAAEKSTFRQELARALRKIDKNELINLIVQYNAERGAALVKIQTDQQVANKRQVGKKAAVQDVLNEIDRAELAFLAGDSEPAQRLVARVHELEAVNQQNNDFAE